MTDTPRHRRTPRLNAESPRLMRVNLLDREDAMERELEREIEKRRKYAQPRQDKPKLIRINLLPTETSRRWFSLRKLLRHAPMVVALMMILGVISGIKYGIYLDRANRRHAATMKKDGTAAQAAKEREEQLRELETKNRYLQNPTLLLNEVRARLKYAQNLLDSGKLELPSRDEIMKRADDEWQESEQAAKRAGIELSPSPDYLNILFHTAVENQPRRATSFQPDFRLFVCHGLESDCEWGTHSLPDGRIIITLEAIAFAENEAELLHIFGHEIGHSSNEDVRTEKALRNFLKADDYNAAQGVLRTEFFNKLYFAYEEREDAMGLETLERAGYNTCAAYEFAQRFVGIEQERVRALRTIIKNKKCGGPVFKIRNETEFRSFKKEFLQMKPPGPPVMGPNY